MLRKMAIDYANKLCLAPMVRSGELPMRLLALKYGCDLVWSPELIDRKLIQTQRIVNHELNTVDFVVANKKNPERNEVVFRTHPKSEQGKLILQLGSNSPEIAAQAAELVIEDVDGIDLNCGCPKSFSTHGGMGAELLKTPDLLCSILVALVENVGRKHHKPISCKIRLLPNFEASKSLIEKICATGISNVTIHCRTPIMRNRQDPIWNYLPKLIPIIKSHGISVVLNGNFQGVADLKAIQRAMGDESLSIMLAEAAETNASVFSQVPRTQAEMIVELFELGKKYHWYSGTKYMIANMTPGKSAYFQRFTQSKNFDQMQLVVDELKERTGSEDRVCKIMTKNCQRPHLHTPAEHAEMMHSRGLQMSRYFKEWDESVMLRDLNDAVTPRLDEQQHRNKGRNNNKKKSKSKSKEGAQEDTGGSSKRTIETPPTSEEEVKRQKYEAVPVYSV
ncbi:uncharacterized protein LODBEIA_P37730 [Lodderomyces beijingensis]|uniref:DUS-like FMN-binding domain-containing protein n=1 Tax=Lodderomyces beijingensis TaxID=1775926 RepID=A0ABP0ZN42_9ASCO